MSRFSTQERFILLLVSSIFAFGFVGCGSSKDETAENEELLDDQIFISESPGMIVPGDARRPSQARGDVEPRPQNQTERFTGMPAPLVPDELSQPEEPIELRLKPSTEMNPYSVHTCMLIDGERNWWTLNRNLQFEQQILEQDAKLTLVDYLVRLRENRVSNVEGYQYSIDSADIRPNAMDLMIAPAIQLMIEDGISYSFSVEGQFGETKYPSGFESLFEPESELLNYGRPRELFRSFVDEAVLEFPTTAVSVGDSWTGSAVTTRYGEGTEQVTTYEFMGVTTTNPKLAVIRFEREASGTGPEGGPYGDVEMTQTGVCYFNLELGRVERCLLEEAGTVFVNGRSGGLRKSRGRVELKLTL